MTTGSAVITENQILAGKVKDDVGNEVASLNGTEDPGPCSCCAKV
jgi:hypothetical protein